MRLFPGQLSAHSSVALFVMASVAVASTVGCANLGKSRYAMDDPVYAAKYEDGAARGELIGKLKQALDARHVEGLSGGYYSGGAQWRNETTLGGAEIGGEAYPDSWISYRAGLAGFIGHGDWYAGLDSGIRTQLPTRLTPFVGAGMFHGLSTTREDATRDGEDNDDDGFADEYGEKATVFDGWLSTVYPEVGIHFWPTGQSRFSVFGRYLVTTQGRDHDDWLVGMQFTAFNR